MFTAMATCIFCPNEANSKEDLFPRWILKRVQNRYPLYRKVGDNPATITEDQEVRLPCVCMKCNNGWMSRLESKVRKYMALLIDDFSLPLDRDYQKGLAEWAVKTAIVNDTVESHQRFFTEAECHAFKRDRTMPNGTQIVAGRFTGRSLDADGNDFTLLVPGGKLILRGHVFTVMVGHLVMQVMSMHVEPEFHGKTVKMECNPGPWDTGLIQIWPKIRNSVEWPPPVSFSTVNGPTHYANFRYRWRRDSGHKVITHKPKA
jgi:hypothetical protein